ncbi:unnamed protein product [Nesidiocoris tenuis]|uniref:Uncharacterized protein n=1 Tax=Nesidiocoris tenuis TaxID=355587 RepID=A0A6H5HIP6_9HEMI|nr:unnamed protein product [Nesidiocoris tenuis]
MNSDNEVNWIPEIVLPIVLHTCLVSSCIAHLLQCYRLSTIFEFVMTSLRTRSTSQFDGKLVFGGIIAHIVLLAAGSELFEYITNSSVCLAGLWNLMIALQFRTIVHVLCYEIRSTAILLRRGQISLSERDMLTDIARATNEAYQIQMIFFMLQTFGYLVSYSFFLIDDLARGGAPNTLTRIYDYSFYITMVVLRIIILLSVAGVCERYHFQVSLQQV